MKISLNFPDNLLTKMDAFCAEHDYERSEFVRSIIRGVLEGNMDTQPMHPKGISELDMVSGSTEVTKGTPIEGIQGMTTADKINREVQDIEIKGYKAAMVKKPHSEVLVSPQPLSAKFDLPEPEYLWDDHNLMPVYKQGKDDQFCSVWHQKGLKQRVFPVKKFDIESKLLWEKELCRECIKKELSTCRSSGGHLE